VTGAGGAEAGASPPSGRAWTPALRTAFRMHEAGPLHDTGWGHPEHQGRLRRIASAVGKELPLFLDRVDVLDARLATLGELTRVHDRDYLAALRERVAEAEARGTILEFGPETPVSSASWEAAAGSSGAVIQAVEDVADGRYRNAFVATRPPGHHASADQAMGFCLVNHVAVGARHLQATGRAARVAIVDWDVHHGNGTQELFYDDPSVYYLSLHQAPWFPGTGASTERGAGPGEGTTRNVPLPAGTDGAAFREALDRALGAAAGEFRPDFVLVSAGYDALAQDPLGQMELEPSDFEALTRSVMAWAESVCSGRVTVVLEGGYEPGRTGLAAVATLKALAGIEGDAGPSA
jgi:acetoin utilization deacetylase AcuC-like enzyme